MTVLAGRYELLEQVGEGGMSVVWRARDLKLERDVAIKLLHSFVAKDGDHLRRFQREARTLAGLAHEHIVRVYDFATSGEQSFLVMEYVAGTNLARATRERLPLSPAEAAAYARPVAEALAYAHAQGVVHRDLTPSNILVELASGRVVTTDFGLARAARSTGSLTATGVLLGTPEFWSPEQALGRESGTAADMYALGCILYLLLSAHLPFEGDDRLGVGVFCRGPSSLAVDDPGLGHRFHARLRQLHPRDLRVGRDHRAEALWRSVRPDQADRVAVQGDDLPAALADHIGGPLGWPGPDGDQGARPLGRRWVRARRAHRAGDGAGATARSCGGAGVP